MTAIRLVTPAHRAWRSLFALVLCACSFAAQAGEAKPGIAYVPLDPFIVNLKDDAYVSFTMELRLAAAQDGDYVKAFVPAVRHELIKGLMGRDAKEVRTPEFMNGFAERAAESAGRIVGRGYVKGAFLTTWVVQ